MRHSIHLDGGTMDQKWPQLPSGYKITNCKYKKKQHICNRLLKARFDFSALPYFRIRGILVFSTVFDKIITFFLDGSTHTDKPSNPNGSYWNLGIGSNLRIVFLRHHHCLSRLSGYRPQTNILHTSLS